MLLRRWVRASVVSGLLLAACGEGSQVPGGSTGPEEPGPTPAPVSGVVASAPVARALLGQAGSETVAFVAAPNGTVARGRAAAVVNRRTGARVDAMVEEGGFDPVALVADDGDVVDVTLTDSGGHVTTTPLAVKRGTKPQVVRTAPEPRATDVPLNSVIRVVFTTPVRARAAAGAIRLYSNGAEVEGAILMNGDADVVVDFEPAAPLAANADYELRVDAALTDVLGQVLESPVAVPFTTGTTIASATAVGLQLGRYGAIPGYKLFVGDSVELVGYAYAARRIPIRQELVWAVSDPAILEMREPARPPVLDRGVPVRFTGIGVGTSTISVAAGAVRGTVTLSVALPRGRTLTVDPEYLYLRPGESGQLNAACLPSLLHECAEFSWTSSDERVVTVTALDSSSRARVTAVSPGLAFVTVWMGGDAATLQVAVEGALPPSVGAQEVVFADSNLFVTRMDGSVRRPLTRGGLQSEPSVAADGRIVFVENGSDVYSRRLRVRERDGSIRDLPVPAPRTWWPPRCPTWSPDMKYIAYLEAAPFYFDGVVRVVFADSSMVRVPGLPELEGTCPSWSPEGRRLTYSRSPSVYDGPLMSDGGLFGTDVYLFELGSSGPSRITTANILAGRWAPSRGAVVAFANSFPITASDEFWVELLDLATGERSRVVRLGSHPAGDAAVPAWSPDGEFLAFTSPQGFVMLSPANVPPGATAVPAVLASGRDPAFVPASVSFTR